MALSTLSFTDLAALHWDATAARPGHASPKVSDDVKAPALVLGTGAANAAAGGADVVCPALVTVPAAGSYSVDLQALTDALGQPAALARLKYFFAHLLPATDPLGSDCSGVTVGNAPTNPHRLFLGAPTHTFVLLNNESARWGTPGAAGLAVTAAARVVLVTNNDAAREGKLRVVVVGGTT